MKVKNGCQWPVCECHPCGPFACGHDAPEKRGIFRLCAEHAIEYDKENLTPGQIGGTG